MNVLIVYAHEEPKSFNVPSLLPKSLVVRLHALPPFLVAAELLDGNHLKVAKRTRSPLNSPVGLGLPVIFLGISPRWDNDCPQHPGSWQTTSLQFNAGGPLMIRIFRTVRRTMMGSVVVLAISSSIAQGSGRGVDQPHRLSSVGRGSRFAKGPH